ncbi:HAD-superfamily hydrolase [Hypoxylon fragiforme]|uniref:HAD-superfamily hydrolase n=1 Tax=Hypoxylon fragiforme TaxID=63214 RepID=UPI0020C6F201|nr:HAD-superfamily hydrolase [Hypoxylon fragiforme]KAI2606092.1 HAD-superfamily hydrolase [Hypoxylon fragiforme]
MGSTKDRTVAFAFDIDGVLMKGKKPVPGARETMQLLQKLKIPFIFLTNGGGHTEEAHVAQLGQRLSLTFDEKQFVQSHTPFRDLVPVYKEKTVLVLGGHGQQIRNLAHAYGFEKVVTSSDVFVEFEHIHPFSELTKAHHEEHGRVGGSVISKDDGTMVKGTGEKKLSLKTTPISAILVWTSPRDWCLDLQIVNDLLLSSGGLFGTRSAKNGDETLPNCGFLQDGQPPVFFCNPDFEWSTSYDHPRFAQGAFREALRGIWRRTTRDRAELQYSMVGKPTEDTYRYAERVLVEYCGEGVEDGKKIDTVYMIGDNPESDIVGANSFQSPRGIEWKSVLVHTGVYVPGTVPVHEPHYSVADVKEAVESTLKNEGVSTDSFCL